MYIYDGKNLYNATVYKINEDSIDLSSKFINVIKTLNIPGLHDSFGVVECTDEIKWILYDVSNAVYSRNNLSVVIIPIKKPKDILVNAINIANKYIHKV